MTGRRFPGFRRLAWAGVALLCVALLALAFLSRHAARGGSVAKAVEPAVEGVDLTYYDFDKENRKKLEVKCRESQRQSDDRLLMKGVTATIFDADKLDKDIRITADAGSAANNFNDFFLEGRARIASSDFSLASRSFLLKDLNLLSGKESVEFRLDAVSGRAVRGLEYYVSQKVLKLFGCRGTWVREGRPYDFRCRTFWVIRKDSMLVLEKDALLSGDGSVVRTAWLSLQFDPDFARLQTAAAIGKSSYRGAARVNGHEQTREIAGDLIQMFHDPQGRLQRLEVRGQGVVSLVAGPDSGRIRSDSIDIVLDPASQRLESARTLARGELSSRGSNHITVAADSLLAVYDDRGAAATVTAEGKCTFSADQFSGAAPRLEHDAAKSRVTISGKGTEVRSGGHTFQSSRFLLETRLRELGTDKGVKATIVPAKKSVLLGARPVFVTADGMDSGGQGTATRFKGKVSLFQDEVELHAGDLLFDDVGNRIACGGGADLKFASDGEAVALRGQTIAFDPEGGKIVIEGEARLQQGPNVLAARRIELEFGADDKLQNIVAADRVSFSKGEIVGKAQLLNWQYARKTVLFRNAAEITRKGAGTTRGQELHFNLDSNEITVSGAGDRSETTLRRERP
jgi:lipopolysaccharide export system protein LptA